MMNDLPQHLEIALVPNAALVTVVRASLRAAMPLWGASELVDTAELLTSEMVSNALQHGLATEISVRATWDQSLLRVEVGEDDAAPLDAVPSATSLDATSGRGLFLIDKLAERWGTASAPRGKTGWFELIAQPTPPVLADCSVAAHHAPVPCP
ncbi:ATP-binding protein [Streptomyces sp. NPDC101227]|uniref:ATP-binding protein n=1 Tax=Streptomyces sp. NPDC101227 TaxID=3366136 RepID=UPI003804F7C0